MLLYLKLSSQYWCEEQRGANFLFSQMQDSMSLSKCLVFQLSLRRSCTYMTVVWNETLQNQTALVGRNKHIQLWSQQMHTCPHVLCAVQTITYSGCCSISSNCSVSEVMVFNTLQSEPQPPSTHSLVKRLEPLSLSTTHRSTQSYNHLFQPVSTPYPATFQKSVQ